MPGCVWCTRIKEVFVRANLEYEEYTLDKNITPDEYFKSGNHPARSNFPTVVIDGETIGGVTDTVRYLVENKLIKMKNES